MKKILIKYLLVVSLIISFFPTGGVNSQTVSPDDEKASPSATITLDEITQNVRERIQNVIKDKDLNSPQKEMAFSGTLQSITGNTLSLSTDQGTYLASTSAETEYWRLPTKKSLAFNDLTIDNYLTVIGLLDEEEVLITSEVITYDSPPETTSEKSFYGQITNYDPKEFLLTLTDPKTQTAVVFLVSRKAILNQWSSDGTKSPLKRTDALPVASQALVIYTPEASPDGGNLAQSVLINTSFPLPSPNP